MDYSEPAPPEPAGTTPLQPPAPPAPDPPAAHRPSGRTAVLYSDDFYDKLNIKSIPEPEFDELTAIIRDNFGIHIKGNKITLLTGRIHPIMEQRGFENYRDYINAVKRDPTGELLSELANRVSTNHTAFHREEEHFNLLSKTILPELVLRKTDGNSRDIRIWTAACATGEEAYSILFTLETFLGFDYANWRAGVLATDISAAALDTAKAGRYNRQKMATVPLDMAKRFFNKLDEETYEVKEEIRREVTFRRLNLISDVYPFRQPFDVVFCRNVMIYFSRDTRMRLFEKLRDWLVPGGFLFIGHSESLTDNNSGYKCVAPAVYARV